MTVKLFLKNVIIHHPRYLYVHRHLCTVAEEPPWKVLFFGADDFSLYSLKALCSEYRNGLTIRNLEVVTTIKGKPNPVKQYSDKERLLVHKWPVNIKSREFDVGLVVSFGSLIPKDLIEKFKYGMLNVHASLLPRWRGAAPIIYALANGDKETGVTIMRIRPNKFDVGEIVHQQSVDIPPKMKMPELYEQLGNLGAQNLIKTLKQLPKYLNEAKPQPCLGVSYAPKVTPLFAHINWNSMSAIQVCNLSRALVGIYHLITKWKHTPVKLLNVAAADPGKFDSTNSPGFAKFDKNENVLKVLCADGHFINVKNVGVEGRKMMSAKDFYNGYMHKEPLELQRFK